MKLSIEVHGSSGACWVNRDSLRGMHFAYRYPYERSLVFAVWGVHFILRARNWYRMHRWDIHRIMLRSGFLWLDEEGGYYKDAYLPSWTDRFKPSPSERRIARYRGVAA